MNRQIATGDKPGERAAELVVIWLPGTKLRCIVVVSPRGVMGIPAWLEVRKNQFPLAG